MSPERAIGERPSMRAPTSMPSAPFFMKCSRVMRRSSARVSRNRREFWAADTCEDLRVPSLRRRAGGAHRPRQLRPTATTAKSSTTRRSLPGEERVTSRTNRRPTTPWRSPLVSRWRRACRLKQHRSVASYEVATDRNDVTVGSRSRSRDISAQAPRSAAVSRSRPMVGNRASAGRPMPRHSKCSCVRWTIRSRDRSRGKLAQACSLIRWQIRRHLGGRDGW
jgi:hypothetical protein